MSWNSDVGFEVREVGESRKALREAVELSVQALRMNFLPGLVLQGLMVVFFCAYLWHEGTQEFLRMVSEWKRQAGVLFAFCAYFFSGGVLPEVLRWALFQKFRLEVGNIQRVGIAGFFWGGMGVVVDFLYRFQMMLFGSGNDFWTVAKKVAFDQFVFSPFVGLPLVMVYFHFWERGRRWSAVLEVFRFDFLLRRALPVMVASWFVWIPAVTLVYNMPNLLQIPIAVTIHAFWVLVFTTITEVSKRRAGSDGGGRKEG
ncbi:MAG: hypothetical protein N2035_07385 [Chthoniobacterales bacterium]|nr:hypothetical protein [Chthoniobacterales bacterium]MCX7713468.1 hypothetical protein [Chthoniobacterales bacterium]